MLDIRVGLRDVLTVDEQTPEGALDRGVEHVRDAQPGLGQKRCAPQVFEDLAHRVVGHVPVAAAARAGTTPCRRSPARCSGRAAGSRRRRRGRYCRTPSPGSPCPSPSSSPGCVRSRRGRSRWHRSAPVAYRRAAARTSAAGTPVIGSTASGLFSAREMNSAHSSNPSHRSRHERLGRRGPRSPPHVPCALTTATFVPGFNCRW